MGRGAQADQGPPGGDPPPGGGPRPHPRPAQGPQGRPSLKVGPAFARTAGHFFPDLNAWLDAAPDARRPDRITYPARALLWYGVLLFAGRLGARRQLDFKYREEGCEALGNVNRLAGTACAALPHNDTLDDYLAGAGAGPVAGLRARMIGRLARMRVLDGARVQGRLVTAVDGSGYLTFRGRHCDHCLTRACGERTLYSHQVLEAKVLGPAETALSLGTEFIDNRQLADTPPGAGEQRRKQDCELKACRRLLEGVRRDFPMTPLCLTLDALYACGTGFQMAKDFRCSFVTVFKEGSLPALWRESQTLLGMCPENTLGREGGGWRHEYRWLDELPYEDTEGRAWTLKAVFYRGDGPNGEASEWAWLVSADLRVGASTVEALAWGAGRARWREENQGFNEQKNGGMAMEHAYSEKGHFGAYYLLMQVAHILMQLLEKGGLLRQLAREAGKRTAVGLLGGLKNIAACLVESLRNLAWPAECFGGQGGIQIRLDSG